MEHLIAGLSGWLGSYALFGVLFASGLFFATVAEGLGLGTPLQNAGAPVAGTDEVQTLTIDATGGTFKLAFDGFVTAAIAWNATNNTLRDNVDAALEALSNIGAAGVTTAVGTMTAGVGTLTITFAGNLGKKAVNTITVANNSLTGTATLTVAETTPGVDATARGCAPGALLVDTTNKLLYQNTGTALAPTWTKVGTQT
jgi:hypothetical protein